MQIVLKMNSSLLIQNFSKFFVKVFDRFCFNVGAVRGVYFSQIAELTNCSKERNCSLRERSPLKILSLWSDGFSSRSRVNLAPLQKVEWTRKDLNLWDWCSVNDMVCAGWVFLYPSSQYSFSDKMEEAKNYTKRTKISKIKHPNNLCSYNNVLFTEVLLHFGCYEFIMINQTFEHPQYPVMYIRRII